MGPDFYLLVHDEVGEEEEEEEGVLFSFCFAEGIFWCAGSAG